MPAKATSLLNRDVSLTLVSRSLVEFTRMVAKLCSLCQVVVPDHTPLSMSLSCNLALWRPSGMAKQ